jgi:hypothetical protein
MPVGLHLNLTLPFVDANASGLASELQELLASTFDQTSWLDYDIRRRRRIDARIREAVDYQLGAFRELYGEPSHIDGHHHIHVHPAVLLCLPPQMPIRPVLRNPRSLGRRGDARERLLRKRFVTVDGCVSFRDVHTALGGSPAELLNFAAAHSVDVMVHTQYDEERKALRTREWNHIVNSGRLGSYRDLIGP